MTLFSILLQNENRTEGERKTLKIIKNNYAPSNVRTMAVSLNLIQRLNVASPLEKNILR